MSDLLFNQDMANSLGWTFIHSLWIGLVLAILLQVGMRIIPSSRAKRRYWFSVSVLGLFVVANAIAYMLVSSSGLTIINLETGQQVLANDTPFAWSISSSMLANGDSYLMYFMQVWIVGAMLFLMKFIIDVIQVNRLKTFQTAPVATAWLIVLEKCLVNSGINKTILWLESPHISTPQVVGYLKPVILFPVGMLTGLTQSQVEAILLHELSHIRRHDYLVNIIQSLIEVIYYFNPFIWFISRRIRIEREHACDDETIASGVSASLYANTLAKMYAFQIERTNLAMSIGSNNKLTLRRIKRIMKSQMNNNQSRSVFGVLLAPILFLCLVAVQWYPENQELVPKTKEIPAIQQTENTKPVKEPVLVNPSIPEVAVKVATINKIGVEPNHPKAPFTASLSSIVPAVYASTIDTIDIEEINKIEAQMDEAMAALESSEEWIKMEELSVEMAEMSQQMMEAMEPLMSQQFEIANEQIQVNEEQLRRLSEMAAESFDVEEIEELKRSMAMEKFEMQKQITEMKLSIEDMNLDLIKEQAELAKELARTAQLNASEINELAAEARKMAEEAEVYSKEIKEYYNKLADMLVKDGYVESKDAIEDLVVRDNYIEINGKKVKKQDLKKYQDLQKAYFKGEDFNFDQHK